jgi:hypothetical protein
MDTSNVNIKMLPSTGETPNDIVTKSAKEQEENLKNKYKKYKRKSKTENQDV